MQQQGYPNVPGRQKAVERALKHRTEFDHSRFRLWFAQPSSLRLFLVSLLLNGTFLLFSVIVAQAFGGVSQAVCHWDCGWYSRIILDGYRGQDPAADAHAGFAFFPAFPLMVRAVRALVPLPFPVVAVLLNTLLASIMSTLAAMYMRSRYGLQDTGLVLLVFAVFPFSFYFHVPYTEAIYGCALMAFLFLLHRGMWRSCGLAGVVLSAARPTGAIVIATLCTLAWARIWLGAGDVSASRLRRSWPVAGIAMLSSVGVLAYMAFLHHRTGDALAFAHAEAQWGRAFHNPFRNILDGLSARDLSVGMFLIVNGRSATYLALVALVALVLIVWAAWRSMYAEAALLSVTFLIGVGSGLESNPRYLFANPAMLCVISLVLSRLPPLPRQTVLLLCAMMQAVLLVLWDHGQSAFLT